MKKLLKKAIIKTGAIAGSAFVCLGALAISKKGDSQYINEPEQKNPLEGKKVVFVEDINDNENADGFRGHLEAVGDAYVKKMFYETYIKRALDILLSFGGLIILSPILVGTAIAIKIDDPGPALFTQKRMGQNKRYFKFHKFRSMKMSTPHDVPTHMLDNPDQYITRVGKFLRAHSLEGNDIIGQTTESLVNKGFREVSPIHFFTGRDLFSKRTDLFDIEGGMNLLALNQGQEAFRAA